ncbi:TPA: hypothetical protein N0F65_010656 [Lagenidium giganteum]|uniref:Uncharacterized protein n=1 Tax=Lagenidium giganteum TaxID=4803 RepID=A0AAV2Z5S2_9STRA|nr:TPA: hypothetical protein N0F65_010656 [Lagenidium giganteum]
MAVFVPCVALAQISHRIGVASYHHALAYFLGVWTLSMIFSGIDYSAHQQQYVTQVIFSPWTELAIVFGAMTPLAVWQLRLVIRHRFHIPGSCAGDCFSATCCGPCAIAQMATHVKSYRHGVCDFGPPDTLPAYVVLET